MIVNLTVPDHVNFQLVYRMERAEPYSVELDQELEFVFLNSPSRAIKRFGVLTRYEGRFRALKAVAKLTSRRRTLYLVTRGGRAVSAGWCTVGRCRYYKIESNAVVIGPIWTTPEVRGKGLASKALQLALNEHQRRGRSLFYIDTEKKNYPAQRVFEKCGFGAPAALYLRS